MLIIIILYKTNPLLNSLQNEPIISKQKLKIVKISQIIDMGFLVIVVYTLHLVYTQIGLNIWNPIKFNTELSFIIKKIHFEMLLKHKYGYI